MCSVFSECEFQCPVSSLTSLAGYILCILEHFSKNFLTSGEKLVTIFSQRKDLDGMKGEKNRQPVNFPFFWLRGVK